MKINYKIYFVGLLSFGLLTSNFAFAQSTGGFGNFFSNLFGGGGAQPSNTGSQGGTGFSFPGGNVGGPGGTFPSGVTGAGTYSGTNPKIPSYTGIRPGLPGAPNKNSFPFPGGGNTGGTFQGGGATGGNFPGGQGGFDYNAMSKMTPEEMRNNVKNFITSSNISSADAAKLKTFTEGKIEALKSGGADGLKQFLNANEDTFNRIKEIGGNNPSVSGGTGNLTSLGGGLTGDQYATVKADAARYAAVKHVPIDVAEKRFGVPSRGGVGPGGRALPDGSGNYTFGGTPVNIPGARDYTPGSGMGYPGSFGGGNGFTKEMGDAAVNSGMTRDQAEKMFNKGQQSGSGRFESGGRVDTTKPLGIPDMNNFVRRYPNDPIIMHDKDGKLTSVGGGGDYNMTSDGSGSIGGGGFFGGGGNNGSPTHDDRGYYFPGANRGGTGLGGKLSSYDSSKSTGDSGGGGFFNNFFGEAGDFGGGQRMGTGGGGGGFGSGGNTDGRIMGMKPGDKGYDNAVQQAKQNVSGGGSNNMYMNIPMPGGGGMFPDMMAKYADMKTGVPMPGSGSGGYGPGAFGSPAVQGGSTGFGGPGGMMDYSKMGSMTGGSGSNFSGMGNYSGMPMGGGTGSGGVQVGSTYSGGGMPPPAYPMSGSGGGSSFSIPSFTAPGGGSPAQPSGFTSFAPIVPMGGSSAVGGLTSWIPPPGGMMPPGGMSSGMMLPPGMPPMNPPASLLDTLLGAFGYFRVGY